ncbi:26S Proteasome non-ATPase regulatory subunit 9 like protein [Aduncisulcus paluster]|uniref:26S Proteasome non-ATPase regulatory subunit 9 like protein n=1 Tax=Aduncisulcus paluster TaxID=2918883 RepID=A0ABQ5KIS1_9EUKA|nr:26S Proteasome non-ATPase regulatory subunit 9 like protein [Aduncisulcus paluster]
MNIPSVEEELHQLDSKCSAIEKKLESLIEEDKCYPRKLTDADGFPISSLDIPHIRKIRNTIACLQNDHVAIKKQIESKLVILHDLYRQTESTNSGTSDLLKMEEEESSSVSENESSDESSSEGDIGFEGSLGSRRGSVNHEYSHDDPILSAHPSRTGSPMIGSLKQCTIREEVSESDDEERSNSMTSRSEDIIHSIEDPSSTLPTSSSDAFLADLVPFARIVRVDDNSPGHYAGLKNDDLIISFGDITKTIYGDVFDRSNLHKLGDIVKTAYETQSGVKVSVRRSIWVSGRQMQRIVTVTLNPQRWAGTGFTGIIVDRMKDESSAVMGLLR